MRCFSCDEPAHRHDQPTGRYYCNECFNIWMKTAYSGDFTLDDEYDTMRIEALLKEVGLDVSTDTSDMS